jgi:sensor histidine kinase regulating citrate/malate metabolism
MVTLDKIVETNINKIFGSRFYLMQLQGFNFNYSFLNQITGFNKDYSDKDCIEIELIVTEMMANSLKAIYGSSSPNQSKKLDEIKTKIGRIEFKVYDTDKNYIISCQDNGDGILEENKENIFCDGFSTRGTTGIGLGLLRKRVIELGGKVYFESEVSKGTTFYIELPKK